MTHITISRGGQDYGPYSISIIQQYLTQGILFPHDWARDASNSSAPLRPLSQVLKDAGASLYSPGVGLWTRIWEDFKSLNLALLFPWQEIKSMQWFKDRKLLYLAGVGLAPMLALALAPGNWASYWLIALYFSGLWSLFFYYLFRTPQIENKICALCYFFTGIVSVAGLLIIQAAPPWTLLYQMAKSGDVFPRFVGMLLGVGINEELCKAAILFWLVKRPGKLMIPQSVVFYGMMSGLGFGIYEGVDYQRNINRAMEIDTAYFLNMLRLTSLPFLHAIWTGIAGYFISFAALYPRRQYGLWIVAIGIPALFHAIYNTFGWTLIGFGGAMLSVILLMTYLANCVRMQKSLVQPK